MNKLTFIIIIFLLNSFPSFGKIDGKGLVCKCSIQCGNEESPEGYFENYKFIHFDNGSKITTFTYEDKDKVNFHYSKLLYRIFDKKIEIINFLNEIPYSLNRETLELTYHPKNRIYNCSVFSLKKFKIKEKEIIEKLNKDVRHSLSKNKI